MPAIPTSNGPGESIIRLMTRKALQYSAINLSQGFPNEPPPRPILEALARGALAGTPERAATSSLSSLVSPPSAAVENDVINQYSMPMGRAELRDAVSQYYSRLYGWNDVDPETNVTITLGATEAMASALRTVGRPGDKIVIMEPFHELYPSQCQIFYLEPEYVTLRRRTDDDGGGTEGWDLDWDEFERAMDGARAVILNTPHNPTGKVFSEEELRRIVDTAVKRSAIIITDDIYEWMCYDDERFSPLCQLFPEARHLIFSCNSIGKSASATGWRVGWCVHPSEYAAVYRGVHDQLVVMAPHPMQYAAETYLRDLPGDYFKVELKEKYRDRSMRLACVLRRVGFDVADPAGAYYLFAKYRGVGRLEGLSPMEAAMVMIREVGVACVPGDNFYGKEVEEGSKYLRFAACRNEGDVEEACERLLKNLVII
mmetsp:Transcript_34264/g.41968  ORF Transcript_34264/g.41968 Transcript_34264/m.41968 type:complete len:428 (-) Transcript_34264:122-1405(-)